MVIEPGVKLKTREASRLFPCGEETIMDLIIKFIHDEAGASAVEYALLMAFIAMAIAASVTTFGAALRDSFLSSTAQIFGGS
jgi:pilus assembly protein Flp/PilA